MKENLERIEKTLAMILIHDMKDAPQQEKALALSRVGFSNADIADLLGAKSSVVTQQLYELRKAKGGKARRKKSSAKKS
jgi:DNA-directed RNA polymerase specialized sigma24 family protein